MNERQAAMVEAMEANGNAFALALEVSRRGAVAFHLAIINAVAPEHAETVAEILAAVRPTAGASAFHDAVWTAEALPAELRADYVAAVQAWGAA